VAPLRRGRLYHPSALIRRTSTFLITFAFSVIAAAAVTAAAAQFTSGVSLVEVYATVIDAAGQPVIGLAREDFFVEEDGVRKRVDTFAAGDFPLAVAIAIDRSFSL